MRFVSVLGNLSQRQTRALALYFPPIFVTLLGEQYRLSGCGEVTLPPHFAGREPGNGPPSEGRTGADGGGKKDKIEWFIGLHWGGR